MNISFPLTWPKERIRSRESEREKSTVKTPLATLWNAIHKELKQWKTTGIVSSNLLLKKDGTPAARQTKIIDSGVAVYFYFNGTTYGLAIDHFKDVAGNLKEILHMLAYMRRLNRVFHRGAMLAMLKAFASIGQPRTTQQPPPRPEPPPKQKQPPPPPPPKNTGWRGVLGLRENSGWLDAKRAYKNLAKLRHPDAGGTTELFQQLNTAYQQAKQFFGVTT